MDSIRENFTKILFTTTNPPIQNTPCVSTRHGRIPRGKSGFPTVSKLCYRGFVIHPVLPTTPTNLTASQGTKVLEDYGVRRSFHYTTEGDPRRQASYSVIKYTGAQNSPRWTDVEQGTVFGSSNDFFEGHQSQADKFEKLCKVRADISTAPHETKRNKTGNTCCTRDFEVILLVGFTELKAQIAWIDSVTVSSRITLSHPTPVSDFRDAWI